MRVLGDDFMHDSLLVTSYMYSLIYIYIYIKQKLLAFVGSRLGKKPGTYDKVDHQFLGSN